MTNMFQKYYFKRTDQLLLALVVLAYAAIMTAQIVNGNNGVFTYTFDDTYIHMSVGENILHGTYGINEGEFGAPSSSILWPFILALFSWTTFYVYMPLVLNILCTIAGIILLYRMFIVALSHAGGTEMDKVNRISAIVLAVVVALASNMIGIMFTGMEHPAQIFLEILILYGLVRFLLDGDGQRMVYLGAILLPLVRYEGMALALPALVAMFILDNRKHAVVAFLVLVGFMYVFSLFLFANSGWFFPASVVLKGQFRNLDYNFEHYKIVFLQTIRGSRTLSVMYVLILLLPSFAWAAFVKKDRAQTAFVSVVLFMIVSYFVWMGNGGDRYVVPLYVVGMSAVVVFFRQVIREIFAKNLVLGAVLALMVAGMTHSPNYFYQKKIPLSAGNIYEQHYTMHHFVTDYYRQPVAVNDIGYVSFRNPHYVLDLAGLADYGVTALSQPLSAATMDSLVLANGTHLVMIYDSWFPNVPDWWIKIGSFDLRRRRARAAGASVSIYVPDTSMLQYARSELRAFQRAWHDPGLINIAGE